MANRGNPIVDRLKYVGMAVVLERVMGFKIIGALATLILLVAVGCGGDGENDSILVLAAASMTDALVEVGEVYEGNTGVDVVFSFGGSNALARQVEFGAPADAVIFAGSGPMDRLQESGNLLAGSRVDLLGNRLVVIGDPGSPPLNDLAELGSAGGRIAFADPALAPAGLYAKQSLESAGLWESLQSRVIPTLDVRAAVGAVLSGGARFGLVYATDAAANSGVEVLLIVPGELHESITYPAAGLDSGNNKDAAVGFLQFLSTDESNAIFEGYGFEAAD